MKANPKDNYFYCNLRNFNSSSKHKNQKKLRMRKGQNRKKREICRSCSTEWTKTALAKINAYIWWKFLIAQVRCPKNVSLSLWVSLAPSSALIRHGVNCSWYNFITQMSEQRHLHPHPHPLRLKFMNKYWLHNFVVKSINSTKFSNSLLNEF